ncbi:MAG TPA: transposase [Saprospiraceae bacterium]|nr:transposase [Saprospiraceae bacterium]
MPDHIHILVRLRPTMAPSEFMQKIKSNSSKWINDNKLLRGKFFWQTGGGIFSVDYTRVDSVRKYIIDQKEHHKKRIFRSEYIELLEKYNIQYDSKYLLKFHDLD